MGEEGYGLTMFVLGAILLPVTFLFGGVIGVLFDIVIFGYLIINHSKEYYSSPSVVIKNINTSIYKFGRNYVNKYPDRELTDDEKKYNDLRCLIYEIAYQTSLKNRRSNMNKYDFSVAASAVPGTHIDDFGVYVKEMPSYKNTYLIYIVEFSDATKILKQNGNYGNRIFLYR